MGKHITLFCLQAAVQQIPDRQQDAQRQHLTMSPEIIRFRPISIGYLIVFDIIWGNWCMIQWNLIFSSVFENLMVGPRNRNNFNPINTFHLCLHYLILFIHFTEQQTGASKILGFPSLPNPTDLSDPSDPLKNIWSFYLITILVTEKIVRNLSF